MFYLFKFRNLSTYNLQLVYLSTRQLVHSSTRLQKYAFSVKRPNY